MNYKKTTANYRCVGNDTSFLLLYIQVMNMNIRILSRTQAVRVSYTDFENDKVIISIKDPWAEDAQFNTNNSSIKEILYLSFYDISEETKDIFGGYSSMSPDDALKIAHFVDKWKGKVDTIWVHCEVGVSRSAGIAMAITEYLNMDLTPILESPTYRPNMLCYELTRQALKNLQKNQNDV